MTGTAARTSGVFLLALLLLIVMPLAPAVADALPKAATDRLAALSAATLGDLAGGRPAAVYARFDDRMRGGVSSAQFAARMKQDRAQSGAIRQPRAHAVTVYRQRETLVAVDWSGRTAGGGAACGFLLWSRAETDAPGIRRFEVNYLPAGLAKGMDARMAAMLMAQFRCAPALIKEMTGVTVNLN